MFGTSKNFVDGVTRHWVLGEVLVIRRGLKKAIVRLVASHRKRLEEFSPAEWLVLAIDLRLNDVKPDGFYLQTVTEDGPLSIMASAIWTKRDIRERDMRELYQNPQCRVTVVSYMPVSTPTHSVQIAV